MHNRPRHCYISCSLFLQSLRFCSALGFLQNQYEGGRLLVMEKHSDTGTWVFVSFRRVPDSFRLIPNLGSSCSWSLMRGKDGSIQYQEMGPTYDHLVLL
jgi:hypothetical protein